MVKHKKFVIASLIIICIIFLEVLFAKVNASTISFSNLTEGSGHVGDQIYVGDPYSIKGLYCIQMGTGSGGLPSTRTITQHVRIEGKKAKYYKNGTERTSKEFDENAVLAYIIGHDSNVNKTFLNNSSSTQLALWAYLDKWANAVDDVIPFNYVHNSYAPQGEGLVSRGKEYAEKNLKDASISNNGNSVITKNGDWVGPCNVEYTGDISSVVVKDSSGNTISNSKLEFYKKNKNDENKLESGTEIKSNQNFYIKTTKDVGSIEINVEGDEVQVADIWLLKHSNNPDSVQAQIYAIGGKTKPTAKLVLKDFTDPGSLTIKKVDADTGKPLKGVQFKLYLEGSGWCTGGKNDTHEFLSGSLQNDERVGIYTTDSDGAVTIKKLPFGTYRVYEIKTSSSQYDLAKQEGWSEQYIRVRCRWKEGTTIKNEIDIDSKHKDVSTGNIENKKYGNLIINKVDDDIKLSGVKFKIKIIQDDDNYAWLSIPDQTTVTGTYEGKYTSVSKATNATTFITNADGQIYLKKLDLGTYKPYEIDTGNSDYILSDQDRYDTDDSYRNTVPAKGALTLAKGERTITFDFENTKTEKGSLIINKIDGKNENVVIAGAKFIIKVGNYFLQSVDSTGSRIGTITGNASGEYRLVSKENATTYITNSKGKITLTNLANGEYSLYETGAGTDYILTEQIGYENGWVPCGTKTLNDDIKNGIFTVKNRKYGNLTINKTDKYNTGTKLNAGFVIQTDKGFLTGKEKGKYKYDASLGEAKKSANIYRTEGGTLTLTGLEPGQYTVYEIEAPQGYKLVDQDGYNTDDTVPKSIPFGSTKELASQKTITFNFKNEKTGNLKIIKTDAATKKVLTGAKFRIKRGEYYIALDNNNSTNAISSATGPYNYEITNSSNATTFVTNTNGEINLNNLKLGTYSVEEIETPQGYEIEDQDGFNDSAEAVIIKSKKLDTYGQTLEFSVKNINGKITINKVDQDGKPLPGAKFKIYLIGKGWVTGQENDIHDYLSEKLQNDPRVGVYTTGDKGTVTINNLPFGKYNIYEVDVPQGYYKEDQGWDTKNDRKNVGTATLDKNNYSYTTSPISNIRPGELTIIKVDDDNNSIKLAGAKFKLYSKSKKQWVTGSKDSNRGFTANQKDGSTFTTDSNGQVKITKLPLGVYDVYEVEDVPSGYRKQDQSWDNTNNRKLCKTVTIDKTHQKVSTGNITNIKTGKIVINKTDINTGDKLSAKFIIKTSRGGFLTGTEGKYKYNDTLDNAKKSPYTTTGGTLTLEGLRLGTYQLYEIGAPSGYTLAYQIGYNKDKDVTNTVKLSSQTLSNTGNNTRPSKTFSVTNEKFGHLKITKTDFDTGVGLTAGFKIKTSKGWLKGNPGNYTYNSSFANATIYYTDDKDSSGKVLGTKTLTTLKLGTYEVYEVVMPGTNYYMVDQDGYDTTNKDRVYIGTGTIVNNGQTISLNKKNKKRISISGYVWVDSTTNVKKPAYNNLYNNGETRISKVTIRLRSKTNKKFKVIENGQIVEKDVITTTTGTNGSYLFNKPIIKSDLANCYVEFDYSGTTYKQYIPVAFNKVATGSKALVNTMPTNDADFKAVATTYKGTARESTYGLTSLTFNDSNDTLENVNLGIKPIPEVSFYANEMIDSVRMEINGYSFTYKYGTPGTVNVPTVPTINFQSGTRRSIKGYTQPVYPSDIIYRDTKNKNNLQVYVKYNINIQNTTNFGNDYSENADLYVEKALHITSLTNRFDTDRYVLSDSNWTASGNIATIKSNYLSDIGASGEGIKKGNTKYKTIEFKVTESAINKVLNDIKGAKDTAAEKLPTQAIINGYHEYTRNDYTWSNLEANLKENKNSLVRNQTHHKNDIEKKPEAPYLVFKLGEDREIKGTVFEDSVDTNRQKLTGEAVGNGKYESKENKVSSAKVELLDSNGNVTKLYKVDSKNQPGIIVGQTKVEEAITTSNSNGEFTLSGIVPGDYYLRFTYGDGSFKITDLNGRGISKTFNTTINNNKVQIKDYKSTIVTANSVKKALNNVEDGDTVREDSYVTTNNRTKKKKNYIWFEKLEGNNQSVAVDNLDVRRDVSDGKEGISAIYADTPQLSIAIENTSLKELAIGDAQKYRTFGGFNFGIIKQPQQKLQITKLITDIRLVNAQNNVILQGNPETEKNLPGVNDFDNKTNGGSTYTRVELPLTSIYGSTINLTYKIEVTNISDVNFYTEDYYKFGDKTGTKDKEVTIKVSQIEDYLDNTVKYLTKEYTGKKVVAFNSTQTDNEEEYKYIRLQINFEDTVLYTNKNSERSKEVTTSDNIELLTERILSSQDDDLEIKNRAKVTVGECNTDKDDTTPTKDKDLKISKVEVGLGEKPKATITIIPNMGEDKQTTTIYAVSSTLALIILSIGIVLLKKRITKE